MALIVFGSTYLVAGGVLAMVITVAKGGWARAFKSVSSGLLAPLGTIFGLLVVFILAQVWSDIDRAESALDREASALRTMVLLAPSFPAEPEAQIQDLVRQHIDEVVYTEWPAMAKHSATLKVTPPALAQALQLAISLVPTNEGQSAAKREMVTAVENALDARRQRIILSQSRVDRLKWGCLFAQAICIFVIIAMASRIKQSVALKVTDPELIEMFDNVAFDEVIAHSKLDTKTGVILILASTLFKR